MDTHYVHFKDSNKKLVATVAFRQLRSGKVVYSTLVVSPDDAQRDISYPAARLRATARVTQFMRDKRRKDIPWKKYSHRKGIEDTHGLFSPFRALKTVGFSKIGVFKDVKTLDKQIANARDLIYLYEQEAKKK